MLQSSTKIQLSIRSWTFLHFPTVPGGKGDPNAVIGTVGDNFFSISSACKDPEAAFKLIQSLTDDVSAQARLDDKRIIPVKGLKTNDAFLNRVMKLVAEASNVQLWYDQELSPNLAQVHLNTTQALFGLSITPEAAAQKMEDAAKSEAKK